MRLPWLRRRRAMAAVAAVLLAAGGALWWMFVPRALRPAADAVWSEQEAGEVAMTSYVVEARRPVEIVSVRPADDPPEGASVTFVACRWEDPLETFAVAREGLEEFCAETAPVRGLRLEPREGRPAGGGEVRILARDWEVLAVVDLGEAPAYLTEGFEVTYRDGLRRGRQTTGTAFGVYRPGERPDGW